MHRLRERAAQLFRGPSRSFRQLRSAAPRQVEPTESLHVLRCRYASYSLSKRQPGSDTLLRQCLVQMAYQPHLLTASVISRLSTDIAQLLLEELIHAGKLTREVLLCFEGVHLWHAPLQGYPGADASWLALLVRAKLTHVDVSDTQVGDDILQALLAHSSLRSLNCSNTRFSDGTGLLRRFPQLTALHLAGCSDARGTPPGLEQLTNLRHLTFARSRQVAVSAVLAAARAMPHLTQLDVSWCRGAASGPDGCLQLDGALPRLRRLNLSNASVPQAVLTQLGELSSLHELKLAAFALGGTPASVQGANVQDSPDTPPGKCEGMLAPLAQLPHLTHLDIRWSKGGERAWDDLARLTALEHLDASFSDLSDTSIACLRQLERLTCLELDSTDLSSKALMSIKRLRSLEVLNLADTTVDDSCLDLLESLTSLQSLNLAYSNITDPGMGVLKALRTLTHLSVDSRLITDKGLRHLAALTAMQKLDLFGCKMTAKSACIVAQLRKVTWLEACGGVLCDAGVAHLAQMSQLTYLSVAQNPAVTDAAYSALEQLVNLQSLNVSGTGMTSPGARFIAQLTRLLSFSMYGLALNPGFGRDVVAAYPGTKFVGAAVK